MLLMCEKLSIDQIIPLICVRADNNLVEFTCKGGYMSDDPNNDP